MENKRDILSDSTNSKIQKTIEKRTEDLIVDLLLRIYFEDGGQEKFKTTEDLIVHFIEERLEKMPFTLQRRITKEIAKRIEPRRDYNE